MSRTTLEPPPAREARERRPFHASTAFRVVLAVVLGGLALVAFGVASLLFLFRTGNPELSHRIIAEVNRVATSDSTRFTSDRVHGTLFRGAVVENPKLLVQTPNGEVAWAQARSMRVEFDLIAFLFQQRQDLRVDLDSPRIDLVHDRNGELVMPRFARKKQGEGKGLGGMRVVIAVKNGAFSMDRMKTRYGKIAGVATLLSGPEHSTIMLDRLAGVSVTPGRPGRLELSGQLDLEKAMLKARPLEIALGQTRITAEVDWDLEKARVREGTLDLHPLELKEFFQALEIATEDGTARGEVTFAGTPTDGQARVCLEGTFAGEPVDTLVLEASSRPGAVDFSGLNLRVRSTNVTGSGTFDTRGVLSADLAFRNVNPKVLPWWKSPENTPEGSLAGRGRFTVRRAAPNIDVLASVDLMSSRLSRLQISRGHVRVASHPNGSVELDSSWVDIPGSRVIAAGTLGKDGTLAARAHAIVQKLEGLNVLLASPQIEAGHGRVDAAFSGTIEAPQYQAQMDLFDTRLKDGIGGDSLTLEVQGKLKPELDLIADAGIRGLKAGARPLGNVVATVSGGKTLRIERYRQALGDTVITLEGQVIFAEEGAEALIDSVALTAGEYHVRNRGPVKVGFFGSRVRVSELALDLDPGTMRLDLDYNPTADAIDARGTIADVDLGRIPGLAHGKVRYAGVVHGDFLASGPLKDPDVSLNLSVVEPTVGDIVGDSVRVDLDYAPGVLTVQQAAWTNESSRLVANGTIRPHVTLQEWLKAVANNDRSWSKRADLALTASLDSFDLKLVAPADTSLRSLQGIATGKARISGTTADPVMGVEGRVSSMSYRGVQGEIAGVDLSYDNRRLKVNRFDVKQNESISQVHGELPLDLGIYAEERVMDKEPMSLTVDIPNGDFSIARILLPDIIGYSTGRYTASAVVSGTPSDARVTGSFKLKGGRIRPAGRDEVLTNVEADATFDQSQLTITKLTARQGEKGKLEATGLWRWPTGSHPEKPAFGPPGTYEFHLTATDFTASDRLTYAARFTGKVDVVNGRDPFGGERPLINGHGTITKGEITLDLSKPPSTPSEPLPFLYSVNVDLPGNFFYRNLDAEVELETVDGPLTFKNEGDGDLALGTLEVRSGKYYVMTREFRNLQGTINFSNPDRIDPDVNVVGETQIPAPSTPEGSRTVYLALTDRVSRLKVRVYDDADPPTPANDLWKALAFGQFVPMSGVSTEAAATGGVDPSVAVPISNYLFQNVERWIGSSGFIDTIDLRGSGGAADGNKSTSAVSVVGVGKYVTPQFYFKYSKDFSAKAEQEISADYRVTRHLLLKGQQIRSTNPAQPPQEYNLDLKIRLEY
ncbi:MAG TPA: translocation/assembly module TamB domain-containing protein [Candidatus Eisenbacteria bacterium]|nr:translocation/assembly module TamB domain-containing protein [Candidatus Eisenbacteria bacterium]